MEHYSPLAVDEETLAAIAQARQPHQLFPIGRLCATHAARTLLDKSGQQAATYVARHVTGDWSETGEQVQIANQAALARGGRVCSSYGLGSPRRLWVITEADRSMTTLLLATDH